MPAKDTSSTLAIVIALTAATFCLLTATATQSTATQGANFTVTVSAPGTGATIPDSCRDNNDCVRITANTTTAQINTNADCWKITNNTTKDLFIPTQTQAEFDSFQANISSEIATITPCSGASDCPAAITPTTCGDATLPPTTNGSSTGDIPCPTPCTGNISAACINGAFGSVSGACECAPEDDPSFCARLGKNCDSVSANDNCGTPRTVNCGSCSPPWTCGGGHLDNICGCDCRGTICGSQNDCGDTCVTCSEGPNSCSCQSGYGCTGGSCIMCSCEGLTCGTTNACNNSCNDCRQCSCPMGVSCNGDGSCACGCKDRLCGLPEPCSQTACFTCGGPDGCSCPAGSECDASRTCIQCSNYHPDCTNTTCGTGFCNVCNSCTGDNKCPCPAGQVCNNSTGSCCTPAPYTCDPVSCGTIPYTDTCGYPQEAYCGPCGCAAGTTATTCGDLSFPEIPNGETTTVACPGGCPGSATVSCDRGNVNVTESCNCDDPDKHFSPSLGRCCSTRCDSVGCESPNDCGEMCLDCVTECACPAQKPECDPAARRCKSASQCSADWSQNVPTPCGDVQVSGPAPSAACPDGCQGSVTGSCDDNTGAISIVNLCCPTSCEGKTCGESNTCGNVCGCGNCTCPGGQSCSEDVCHDDPM